MRSGLGSEEEEEERVLFLLACRPTRVLMPSYGLINEPPVAPQR